MHLNTFTIVGRCERTGMLGVAVCTAAPGVGGYCPFARAKVGAVATMSWVNPYIAIDGLSLMAEGMSAEDKAEYRQSARKVFELCRKFNIISAHEGRRMPNVEKAIRHALAMSADEPF